MVDFATRYQLAAVLKEISSKQAAKAFLHYWISVFGPPDNVVSDQGAEFHGDFASMLTTFGISHNMIGSESPWQAGLTERHGGSLKAAIGRVVKEQHVTGKKEVKVAMALTSAARNAIPGPSGFSPAQWVLGKSVRLPADLINRPGDLPSHQAALEVPAFSRRLELQRAAQAAMLAVDGSSRLRRALLRRS